MYQRNYVFTSFCDRSLVNSIGKSVTALECWILAIIRGSKSVCVAETQPAAWCQRNRTRRPLSQSCVEIGDCETAIETWGFTSAQLCYIYMYSKNSVYDHLPAATNPSLRPVFSSPDWRKCSVGQPSITTNSLLRPGQIRPLSGRIQEFLLYLNRLLRMTHLLNRYLTSGCHCIRTANILRNIFNQCSWLCCCFMFLVYVHGLWYT